ncbi:MAG: recombination mediator RecR [Chloroflexota bacterium]|nr:recombination mediator RecR [Chloroflexota bacterium]
MQRSPATAPTIARLIEAFHRLPGIGPKSAQRLAYHVLRAPRAEAEALAEALIEVKDSTRLCGICQNITDADPCVVCLDPQRSDATVCVVEEPLDVAAIERAGVHRGRYHVLHGAISPMDGVGPEDLKVRELLTRLGDAAVEEVILAMNPNLEGEATAGYLSRVIGAMGVRITRIAHGLPVGADVEYADERTLRAAMTHRVSMDQQGNDD